MSLWISKNKSNTLIDIATRTGLRLRIEKEVNPEVRRACLEFARWLRKEYYFPVRVPVYIKAAKFIKAVDGDEVSATFFWPFERDVEPYIRVATGDYYDLEVENGEDNALAAILHSIAHELTHYYQWILSKEMTVDEEEKQAVRIASYVIGKYRLTRDHP